MCTLELAFTHWQVWGKWDRFGWHIWPSGKPLGFGPIEIDPLYLGM